MIGIRHSDTDSTASITSQWSVSTISNRSVSTASIVLPIESNSNDLNECSPLLASSPYRSRSYTFYADYGLKNERNPLRHYEDSDEKLFPPTNHDRHFGSPYASYSSKMVTQSMYHYESRTHLCSIRLFGVLIIFISGLIIATYLMIVESRIPTMSFSLDLVNHDIWSKIPLGTMQSNSSFLNVLLLHTGGTNCDNSIDCINILREMQQSSNQTELPYNFLVADDGQTYEAWGWNHQSFNNLSLPLDIQASPFIIGFIGNYTNITPNAVLLRSALSIMKESVRRRRLRREYRVYVIRNITVAGSDANGLFESISNWPCFERVLNVL